MGTFCFFVSNTKWVSGYKQGADLAGPPIRRQTPRGASLPVPVANGSATFLGPARLFHFALRYNAAHPTGQLFPLCQRAIAEQAFGTALQSRPQARPFPVLATVCQSGPQRFALNVLQRRQVMIVLLDREGLEPAPPDTPADRVMSKVTPHMGGEQPLHPAAQGTGSTGQQQKVKVIRHQAET
jgi:hypothetical protein